MYPPTVPYLTLTINHGTPGTGHQTHRGLYQSSLKANAQASSRLSQRIVGPVVSSQAGLVIAPGLLRHSTGDGNRTKDRVWISPDKNGLGGS